MKRDLQTNEILTNVVFEFSVKGKDSLNALLTEQVALGNKENSTARLIGVSLKKPTARFNVFITPCKFDVESIDKEGIYLDTTDEYEQNAHREDNEELSEPSNSSENDESEVVQND